MLRPAPRSPRVVEHSRHFWWRAIALALAAVLLSQATDAADAAGGAGSAASMPFGPITSATIPVVIDESPAALEQRQRSRTAFANESSAQAAETARQFYPAALDAAPWRSIHSPAGMRLDRFVNDFSAQLVGHDPDGTRVVATSSTPIRPIQGGDRSAPVDLTLADVPEGYAPRNPVYPARIGARVAAGTTIGRPAVVRFAPDSVDPEAAGIKEGPSVFFANVGRDTDYIVTPVSSGIEASFQLRSVASPEDFRLHLALAPGARPEPQADGRVAVVSGDTVVAFITAPRAWDATGRAVPATMAVDGHDLVLNIPHRSFDAAYPLLLDPAVLQVSRTWSWYQGDADVSGWRFQTPYSNFGPYSDASGLYSRNLTPSFFGDGWWGKWYFQAPGSAWIGDAWMSNIDHDRQGYGGTCFYTGLEDAAGNPNAGSYQEVCDNASSYTRGTVCCMSSSTRGNKLAFGETFHGSADRTYWEHLGGVTIDLFDDDDPTANVSGPSGWTNNDAAPITFQAHDSGTGVLNGYLYLPGATWSGRVDVGGVNCTRAYCGPDSPAAAATTTVGNLPEGSDSLIAHVVDVAGHTRDYPFEVKVDRTPPSLAASGPFIDQINSGQPFGDDDNYELWVDASDPLSGVLATTVRYDGSVVQTDTQDCPATEDACPLEISWDLTPAQTTPGSHTVSVTATDRAGSQSQALSWTIQVVAGTEASNPDGTRAAGPPVVLGAAGASSARCTTAGDTTAPLPSDDDTTAVVNGVWAGGHETTEYYGSDEYFVARCNSAGGFVTAQRAQLLATPDGSTFLPVAVIQPSSNAGEIDAMEEIWPSPTDPNWAANWPSHKSATLASVIPPDTVFGAPPVMTASANAPATNDCGGGQWRYSDPKARWRWPGSHVHYWINNANNPHRPTLGVYGSAADTTKRIIDGFRTWNQTLDKCRRFRKKDSFTAVYDGLTSASVANHADGRNTVAFSTGPTIDNDCGHKDIVGCTHVRYNGSNVFEFDMTFDARDAWSNARDIRRCSGDRYDVWEVATHEAGHVVGLGHVKDPYEVMVGGSNTCDSRQRVLGPGDVRGVRKLYP